MATGNPLEYWSSDLTDMQVQIIAYLQVFSGSLSIVASVWLIYIIFALQSSESWSYARLVFGLSVFDILSSVTYIMSPFLLPSEKSSRVVACGNQGTCEMMAFMYQFGGIGSILYSSVLNTFFYMVVHQGMDPDVFERKMEQICHFVAIGYPMVTAYMGLLLGVYGEAPLGLGCWVINGRLNGWILGGFPLASTFAWILWSNIKIYQKMNWSTRQIQKAKRNMTIINERRAPTLARSLATKRANRIKEQSKKTNAMVSQAFFYVLAFLLTGGFVFLIRMYSGYVNFETFEESTIFPLHVFHSFFAPLQGTFNLAVFIRPSYIQNRLHFPLETRMWCIRRALIGNSVTETVKIIQLQDAASELLGDIPEVTAVSNELAVWSPINFSRPFPKIQLSKERE